MICVRKDKGIMDKTIQNCKVQKMNDYFENNLS